MSLCYLNRWLSCLVFICMGFTCVKAFLHAHVSFAVIGFGWLQALRVAGVHLITAKRGGQAHPPLSSPLNIFMYQVGILICSSHLSWSQIFLPWGNFIFHYSSMQTIHEGHLASHGNRGVWKWSLCRISIPHIIALAYSSPHTLPLPSCTFLYNHPSSFSLLIIPTQTLILPSFTPRFTSPSPLSLLSHSGPQHLQEAAHL